MRDLLGQIQSALDSGLYYLALYVTLTLPDICGALDSEDGLATGTKYERWFDDNVAAKYHLSVGGGLHQFLTGKDCYQFRCSLLHQGTSQHPKSQYARYIFLEPGPRNITMHCNVMDDALNLDVKVFCKDVLDSVDAWLERVEKTDDYQRNFEMFMRRYPEGLPPYIIGAPVIS